MHAALLTALVALAAPEPPATPPPPAEFADAAERNWNEPPPGSPEDQALWRELRQVGIDAVMGMARVSQAAYRLRWARYYETLDERIAAAPEQAAAARAQKDRLVAAARAADDAIPKKNLRVRPCKYVHLDLDTRLATADDPRSAAALPKLREEARACATEVGALARKVVPLAEALERELDATDAFLGRPRPDVPRAPDSENPYSKM